MKRVLVLIGVACVSLLIGFASGCSKGYGSGFRNGEDSPERLKSYEVANCPCEFSVENEKLRDE